MKISFGRKFFGCVIATTILMAMYFTTLAINPSAITPGVTTAYGGFIMFLWVGYIGGNMFAKWATGKYFQEQLMEGK